MSIICQYKRIGRSVLILHVITENNGVLISIKNPIELAEAIQVYMDNFSKIDRDKISKEITGYGPSIAN